MTLSKSKNILKVSKNKKKGAKITEIVRDSLKDLKLSKKNS